jgi:hypothetical protein
MAGNFILKLQKDWAYRKEYNEAEERLKRLACGLHKREEKEKEGNTNKGGKLFYGRVCPNNREGEESTRISAYRWRQKCLFSMEMGN